MRRRYSGEHIGTTGRDSEGQMGVKMTELDKTV